MLPADGNDEDKVNKDNQQSNFYYSDGYATYESKNSTASIGFSGTYEGVGNRGKGGKVTEVTTNFYSKVTADGGKTYGESTLVTSDVRYEASSPGPIYYLGIRRLLEELRSPETPWYQKILIRFQLSLITNPYALAPGFQTLNAPIAGILSSHEALGGHTIARHVAKTNTDLLSRLTAQPHISGASTFTNMTVAESVVSQTLAVNNSTISAWARTAMPSAKLPLNYSGATVIGRGIPQGQTIALDMTNAKVILKSTGNGNYFVLTSYPQ